MATAAQKGTPRPPAPDRFSVRMNVSGTRYAVVKQAAEQLDMAIVVDEEDNDCDVFWIDAAVPLEKYMNLKPYQILNHFPGMGEICRKDSLARNIQKFRRFRSEEYNITPMTWVLPSEYGGLMHFTKELKRRRRVKTFIVKPPNGAMGNGISLTRSIDVIPQGENLIIQEYIDKPLLLDGFKFDLRVYVLVTSCQPLRIFVYKDGLVRLSTQLYSQPTDGNLGQHFMHLTNYSINKHSNSFDKDEDFDKGSKRSLQYFNGWLVKNGYNAVELWSRIHDLIIKTLIVAQPHVQHSYQACRPGVGSLEKCQCFEVLGFDVLVDENLRPWLLEVNRSPSFGIDTQLDLHIKTGVISDALRLLNIKPTDRTRRISLQRVASRRRLLQSSTSATRSVCSKQPLDFAGEHEESVMLLGRKREEVKCRLLEMRRSKELEQHENEFMGDYQRIYPSVDPHRQVMYESLLTESARISYTGRSQYHPQSLIRGLDRMREKELIDLLSQYETEEKYNCLPTNLHWLETSAPSQLVLLTSLQQQSLYESSPMEAELKAMAAREHEEEQTQRTMLALNSLQPSYPGKDQEEVNRIYQQVQSDWSNTRPQVGSFWLLTLDSMRRKQLLNPTRESVKNLVKTFWRSTIIDSIRLNKVFVRLFNFLLANHGQGLWSTFPGGTGEHWERTFQRKYEVISMSELHCCRRIAELCRAAVIAAYHYNNLSADKRDKMKPSLFPARRRSDITLRTPTTYTTAGAGAAVARRPLVVQLYGRGKSRSVPIIGTATARTPPTFPK